MATVKLTKRGIDQFVYHGTTDEQGRASRDIRWDTETRGFGVRVYPFNEDRQLFPKAFVLSYRVNGRKRLMTIADYGDLTLSEARDRATKYRVQAKDGIDPLEEKRQEALGSTFGDLCKRYLDKHAKVHKKTWKTDDGRLERHIPRAWKSRKVQAISHADIQGLHREIGRTRPYEANRTLDLLRVMFNVARPWYPVLQKADNPADNIKKFAESERKRFARADEMPRIARAIDAESNVYVRAALWLYLLTGARKQELLPRNRSEIERSPDRIRLPDTKSGEEQYIPLSAPAMAIVQAIPEVKGNPYLLPGARQGKHLVNIDKPWRRVRKAAGCEDLTLHDLRRSVGSWMTDDGVDLNRIKNALRHANISTTMRYARLGDDAAREPLERHGKRIIEATGRVRVVERDIADE